MALVGSNGAGKSTTLKALMGLKRLTSGSLELDGQRIDGTSAAQRVGMGIALSPEGRRLFPRMSVWENLMVGAHTVISSEQRNRSLDLVYELFPRVQGTARANGRITLGRRAADGGDWPRDDVEPAKS